MRILLSAQDGASSAIRGVGNALGSLPGPMGAIAGVGLAVGAVVVGIGAASVKMAADYQQSMLKVQSLTGSSQQQMAQYDGGLKALAVNAGVAPKALADGLYNVLSAGYKGAAAMNVLTLATQDSKIGMTDAATTTNALTNVMANFKVKASDANIVNGQMLETVTLGKATFSQYASNITKAASTASQYNQTMSSMNAAWSTLTASGISAGMATTDYDQSLSVMDGNIGTVTKSLNKNGIAFDQTKFNAMDYGHKVVYLNDALQKANDMHVKVTGATKQAAQAIHTIAQHIDTYNKNLATLSDKQAMAKKTQDAWAITQQGFNQQMSRLSAIVQVIGINIGNNLLPILTQVAKFVADNILPALQKLGGFLSSALGPVFQQVGKWLSQIDWKGAGQQAGQLLLNLSPMGELFQSVSEHAKDLGKWFQSSVVPALKQAEPGFKNLGQALMGLGPLLKNIGDTIHSSFKAAFDALLPVFEKAIPLIIKIAGIVADGLGKAIKFLTPYVEQATQAIGKFAGDIATRVAPIVSQWLDGLSHALDFFKAHWTQIWGVLGPILKGTWDQIVGVVKIAWAVLSGIIKIGLDIMSGNWKQAWEDFKTMLSGVWDGIVTYLRGAMTMLIGTFKPLLQALSNIPGPVGDMAKKVLGSFNSMDQGTKKSTSSISNSAADMKAKVIAHTVDMEMQAVQHFDLMRQKLIDQIKNTSDPVQKHTLEMKLGVVEQMEQMHTQAAQRAQALAQDVISHTQNMSDQVVGHSIVPDMVNSVIQWFEQLGPRALSAVSSMAGQVLGALGNLASMAVNAGASVVKGIASGIMGAIGDVTSAIGNVVGVIDAHLPHSPAKVGPLSQLNEYGPALVNAFAQGILDTSPAVWSAMQSLTTGVASGLASTSVPGIGGGGSDKGVLADQLSFTHAPTSISSGKKAPVKTAAEKKREADQLKAAEKTDAAEFKAIDTEIASIRKREAAKIKADQKATNAEIKAIETRDKHLKGSAKKAEEAQIKSIRAHEKVQIANERKIFEAKIKADKKKETQLKQEIHLNLTVHATKLDAAEVDKLAKETIKQFGDQIRNQFANV